MCARLQHPVRLALAAVLLTGSVQTTRADHLDEVLTGNATALLDQLAAKGYSNVGVLKFEVQTGGPDGPIAMNLGEMNSSMATRLENALIVACDPAKPVGIIRGAGAAAVKADAAATYHTAEGRRNLLAGSYPLAWGNKSVKADALLVGRVSLDSEWKTATVSVRYFGHSDPAEWQDLKLERSSVPVTRQTLADLGQTFTVPQLVRKRGGEREAADPLGAEDADKAAVPIVARARPQSSTGLVPETQPEVVAPATRADTSKSGWAEISDLLTFKVFYDGVEAPRQSDGNYPSPKPGQEVRITLRSTERIGLVLLVNGINTADSDRQHREAGTYRKWVLKKNTDYLIRGYYTKDRVDLFETAPREKAERALSDLAPRARFGQIELHVYTEVEDETLMARNSGLRDVTETADTLATLKEQILTKVLESSKPTSRCLIIPGKSEAFAGETTEFTGILAARVVATYATPADDKGQ